jgi:hypothetical protein
MSSALYLTPLISKLLFLTVLKEEGCSYGINSPINLQILQLESHGFQLSGAKNRTFLSHPDQILLQGNTKKLLKIKKGPCTVKHTVKKIYTFLRISQEPVVIS